MLTTERNGNHRYYLPENNDDLTQVIALFKALPKGSYVGLDTETTGLDYIKDKIAGPCIAFLDKGWYHGFYLPVRHVNSDCNLDKVRVFKFTNWILHRFQTVLFNRSYDFSMLENEEEVVIDNIASHDVQIMCWEATYEKFPSLKVFYRQYCKKEIDSFASTMSTSKKASAEDDTTENEHDFTLTDPRQTYTYAAEDPVATLELFFKIQQLFPFIKAIYPLDNKVSEVLRQLTKNIVHVDYDVVRKYAEEQDRILRNLQREIYDIAGYQFNIGSSREKAEALSRFVSLTTKTKKGDFAVSIPVLKKIDHPLAVALINYSEAFKFRNSYLTPFLKMEGTDVRFNYKTVEAPTARIASGTSRGNSFYSPMNVQSIPKEMEILYLHEDPVLGIRADDNSEGALGTYETKAGLRKAFIAPKGYIFLTCDYCLHPDTKVLTREGMKPLKELKNGEEVWTPVGWRKAINPRYTGMRKQVKIKLKTGEELICSPDHKIRVKREGKVLWVVASELKSTDYIFSISTNNKICNHGIS